MSNEKPFIDRTEELLTLEKEYAKSMASFVIVYGRRRVGKTALINEFLSRHKGCNLYFLATQEAEGQNRKVFRDQVADLIGNELLKSADADWLTIFKLLSEHTTVERKIIVMDEFQYIGKSNPAFPSVMQKIWDTVLKDTNTMLILCGSLITLMQQQTLDYSSPLYGRRTAQIRLKQIRFPYYPDFFPGKSEEELIPFYAVTGGVPKYIEVFSESRDIYRAIQRNVLNRSGYLYDEPHFLLQQEVSEIGSYFSVIRVIAAGNHKLAAISSALEVKATSLTKYLKTLIDLDILEREVPITEDNPEKSKRGLYRIRDNYIRFWFTFIYPNMSFIESGNSRIVLDKIRRGLVTSHIAFVYEDVCREKMWDLNANDAWPFHFSRIGRYWDANTEIDIAALDPEGKNLILGECKYWQEPVGVNILCELEQKAEYVSWNKDHRRIWFVLFSMGGFTDELKQLAKDRSDLLLIDDSEM